MESLLPASPGSKLVDLLTQHRGALRFDSINIVIVDFNYPSIKASSGDHM